MPRRTIAVNVERRGEARPLRAELFSTCDRKAAEIRRETERLSPPLLPGQLVAMYQVQRGVQNRIWTLVSAIRPCWIEITQPDVVIRIETREAVWMTVRLMRGAQITADQPVLIKVVHGK